MIATQLMFTAKPGRAPQFIRAVKAFIADLRKRKIPGMAYRSYRAAPNVFVHLSTFETAVARKRCERLESFANYKKTILPLLKGAPEFMDMKRVDSSVSGA